MTEIQIWSFVGRWHQLPCSCELLIQFLLFFKLHSAVTFSRSDPVYKTRLPVFPACSRLDLKASAPHRDNRHSRCFSSHTICEQLEMCLLVDNGVQSCSLMSGAAGETDPHKHCRTDSKSKRVNMTAAGTLRPQRGEISKTSAVKGNWALNTQRLNSHISYSQHAMLLFEKPNNHTDHAHRASFSFDLFVAKSFLQINKHATLSLVPVQTSQPHVPALTRAHLIRLFWENRILWKREG